MTRLRSPVRERALRALLDRGSTCRGIGSTTAQIQVRVDDVDEAELRGMRAAGLLSLRQDGWHLTEFAEARLRSPL